MPSRTEADPNKMSLAVALARWSDADPVRRDVALVVLRLAYAAARLSALVRESPLQGLASSPAGSNASGDDQKPLDLEAEALFVAALHGCDVAAVCSEETQEPIALAPAGSLVVTLDPVDGSSNIETLAPIGTIFSVLPVGCGGDVTAAALRPGREQLAAGLVVYGSSTMLLLTVGEGTDLYALDPQTSSFVRVRAGVALPPDAQEYAINASNARHWGPGIRDYIDDLVSGSGGPREREFNMRWLASLVGEAYRIFIRGGIFLYPADARPGYENGRIRLVYEANPVAFLCEQAGGAATDGTQRILDLVPTGVHQRVPFVFGSSTKVERVSRYLQAPPEVRRASGLFSQRGLLRGRSGGA